MNIAFSDSNKMIIYPREKEVITQKEEKNSKVIELKNLEED